MSPEQRLRRVSFPAPENGTEVLWAECADGDSATVVSVSVFAYGISRGAVLHVGDPAESPPRSLRESPGATIRCYVETGRKATEVYLPLMVPEGRRSGLAFGPATLLDPDIVAIHVHDRGEWTAVGRLCDGLVRRGILRFRELADPDPGDDAAPEPGDATPWSLVHPEPADGP